MSCVCALADSETFRPFLSQIADTHKYLKKYFNDGSTNYGVDAVNLHSLEHAMQLVKRMSPLQVHGFRSHSVADELLQSAHLEADPAMESLLEKTGQAEKQNAVAEIEVCAKCQALVIAG